MGRRRRRARASRRVPSRRPRGPRAMLPVQYERDVQKSIIEWMRSYGCIVWRRNVGAVRRHGRYIRFGEKGQADIYGILPDGRHFECEVKRPGKRPSADQLLFLMSTNRIGQSVSFWAWSLDVAMRVVIGVMRGAYVEYEGHRGDYALVHPPA
jgi:hypothetical protein